MHKNIFICTTALLLVSLSGTSFGQTANPVPQIIVRVNLTGQTNPIPTTTLFVPPANGLFRFSGVMVTTVPNGQQGRWSMTVGWTNDAGIQSQCCVITTSTETVGGGLNFTTTTVRSNAGMPITYSVEAVGDTQGSTYELFFIVERLE